ncbi:hypothetical protein DFJ77DRAFT_172996 [Powellomyces hirtus]|nr:hypothetical protein DFJ77DRAFT_172996 [Powellomyces hirtus]
MYQEKVAVRRRQEFSIKPVDKDILPKNVFPESPTGSNHSRGSKGSNHSNSGGSDPDSRRGQRFDSSKATSLKSEPSRSTNNNNDNNRYTGGGGSGTLSLADSEPRQSRSRQQSREVEQRGEQRRSVYRPSSLGEDEENGEKEERGSQASASRRSQASSLRWRASENALSESSRNDFGTVKVNPIIEKSTFHSLANLSMPHSSVSPRPPGPVRASLFSRLPTAPPIPPQTYQRPQYQQQQPQPTA